MNNYSSNFVTVDPAKQQLAIESRREIFFPIGVLLCVFCALCVPGNIIVLMVYWRQKKITSTKMFISFLAINDLVTGLFIMPFNIISLFDLSFDENIFICKYLITSGTLHANSSEFLILLLTVLRYCRVCKPHLMPLIERKLKVYSFTALTICVLLAVDLAVISGFRERPPKDRAIPGKECFISDKYRGGFLFILYTVIITVKSIACTIAISLLNFALVKGLLRRKRLLSDHVKKRSVKSKSRASTMSFPSTQCSSQRESTVIDKHQTTERKTNKSVHSLEFSLKDIFLSQKKPEDMSTASNSVRKYKKAKKNKKNKYKYQTPSINSERSDMSYGNSTTGTFSDVSGFSKKSNMEDVLSITMHEDEINSERNEWSIGQARSQKSEKIHDTRAFYVSGEKQMKFCDRCKYCMKRIASCVVCSGVDTTNLKVAAVNIVYLLTYLPYIAATWWIESGKHKSQAENHDMLKYVIYPSIYMMFLRSGINPLVYIFLDPSFRRECWALFRRPKNS